ncbi:MAG: hypothetical protein AVDCRST_MAG20-1932 [uncultured Acidimicrobiales bacterium]|uniref:Uncharacterized protein n=1 Tax=uncultured Acidimicrobiales bacterium TaxID=310071 RepID=A0A6J4I9L9_9ACTN|nr:MAG: hypothetical protein AVDCRST_MAG20-1932 [uncultured Acidimicrobiales bacterium]
MHGVKLGFALAFLLSGALLFQLRGRRAEIRGAMTQVVIGTIVGAGGAGLVLSSRVDLVPDRWESFVVALLGVGLAGEVAVVLWLRTVARSARGIVRS